MPLVSNSLKTLLSFSAVLTMNAAISFAAAQDAPAPQAAPTPQDAAAASVEAANVELADVKLADTEAASGDEPAVQTDVALEADAVSDTESDIAAVASADYSMMNLFMEKLSANERGRPSIAYELVRENALPVLDEYEEVLTAIDTNGMSDDDRLAYWLNAVSYTHLTLPTKA